MIFESLDWKLDFHTGYEISNVFLLSTINHITNNQNPILANNDEIKN